MILLTGFLNCFCVLVLQEAPVLGSVGSFSYPLPGHRFLDNRLRIQTELHSGVKPSLKPPFHTLQLLPSIHTTLGSDEKQQVMLMR